MTLADLKLTTSCESNVSGLHGLLSSHVERVAYVNQQEVEEVLLVLDQLVQVSHSVDVSAYLQLVRDLLSLKTHLF